MRFVAISDTHGCHRDLKLPKGDVILHAGDICDKGNATHVQDFIAWFADLDFEHKIFISGNHDIDLDKNKSLIPKLLPKEVVFLNGNFCQVGAYRIWGSPTEEQGQVPFHEILPEQVDILLTHRPPYGILDQAPDGLSKGSEPLAKKVKLIRPQVHVYGHIHASYGLFQGEHTHFINASNYRASRKRIVNDPVVFDLKNPL